MTIKVRDLARSRLADSVPIINGRGDFQIATIQSADGDARPWRVAFARAARADGRPPLGAGAPNNSSSIFTSQLYGYAAGFQNTPALPPRRDAPVAGGAGDADPLFCQIAWGMGSGRPNRILAHWPMQGASIVVVGSYVEVWAGAFLQDQTAAELPILAAAITPWEGLASDDAGELSIQQSEPVTVGELAGDAAVVYVPDFARRVRVVLRDLTTGHVLSTGHPRAWLDWFDDRGNIVDSWMQGSAIGVTPDYQAVPARAVLLRVGSPGPSIPCNEDLFTEQAAEIHWRLAP